MDPTERTWKRSAFPPPGAAQVPPRPRLRLSVAFGMSAPAHHTARSPGGSQAAPWGAFWGDMVGGMDEYSYTFNRLPSPCGSCPRHRGPWSGHGDGCM